MLVLSISQISEGSKSFNMRRKFICMHVFHTGYKTQWKESSDTSEQLLLIDHSLLQANDP